METKFIDGHGECEVWGLPKLGSTRQHRYRYTPDSFTHPAKMDVVLCRKILETYTRKEELVLDPMAGISTTQIEAALLRRNAIGVELEEKFVKISERNIKLLNKLKTLAPKGRAEVIKGDARELSRLLKEKADVAVFSPPFGDAQHDYKHGLKELGPNFKGRTAWEQREKVETSSDNISNLPYKPVDAVVFSPPYTGQIGRGIHPHLQGLISKLSGIPVKDFDNNPKLHKKAVAIAQEKLMTRYSRSKENIANLPYGIDAVVFSPPFGEAQRGGGIAQKGYEGKHGKDERLHLRHDRKFSEDEKNISNLPYGVDAVVFSPPYSGSNLGGGDAEARKRRLIEAGHDPKEFLGGKARNAILRHYDEVDAVITSPPYSDSEVGKGVRPKRWEKIKDKDGFRGRKEWKTGTPCHYSDSLRNIGNLPHGRVDAVITSPPYSNAISRQGGPCGVEHVGVSTKTAREYSPAPQNIGNLSYEGVDAVITSPPYQEIMSAERHESPRARKIRKEKHLGHYPKSDGNIGKAKGETYLQAMLRVYAECFRVLKPGGKMVLVLKRFVRNRRVVKLDLDTRKLCEAAGFVWEETKLFKLPSRSFWRILYRKKFGDSVPELDTLDYEFVEVFERPPGAWA